METIVSIDFDVIMGPSIELYNHLIDNRYDVLAKCEKKIPLLYYANANYLLYVKLSRYLYNIYINHPEVPIYSINTHEEILQYITSPINLINIDHHHDLGYSDEHIINPIIGCGNWVYWAWKRKYINNYIWLHNSMSSLPTQNSIPNKYIEADISSIDLKYLCIPDKIIICSSYQWIPTQLRPLFELWEQKSYTIIN